MFSFICLTSALVDVCSWRTTRPCFSCLQSFVSCPLWETWISTHTCFSCFGCLQSFTSALGGVSMWITGHTCFVLSAFCSHLILVCCGNNVDLNNIFSMFRLFAVICLHSLLEDVSLSEVSFVLTELLDVWCHSKHIKIIRMLWLHKCPKSDGQSLKPDWFWSTLTVENGPWDCSSVTWYWVVKAKGQKTSNKHLGGQKNRQNLIQFCQTWTQDGSEQIQSEKPRTKPVGGFLGL